MPSSPFLWRLLDQGGATTKRFELSFLYSNGVGAESSTAGYRARRAIWEAQEQITLPKAFLHLQHAPPSAWENLAPYPFDSKTPLFESMFSVIVENDDQPHYFTEKIVDALRTHTVPLYFGAPQHRQVLRHGGHPGLQNR